MESEGSSFFSFKVKYRSRLIYVVRGEEVVKD